MNTFTCPQGEFTLNRYPEQKDDQLRAWDAADEYLLSYIQEQDLLAKGKKGEEKSNILIINDAFGALTVSLAAYKPTSISDSYLSQQALLENTKLNYLNPEQITISDTLLPLNGTLDIVIIKIPKTLSMLEDELFRIRNHCNENTVILAGSMTKHIHTSTMKLFEHIIGETKSTLARKKARLITSKFDPSLNAGSSPYPGQYTNDITNETYLNHANVFSREKLDIGSRFMLQHIPESGHYKNILDLA